MSYSDDTGSADWGMRIALVVVAVFVLAFASAALYFGQNWLDSRPENVAEAFDRYVDEDPTMGPFFRVMREEYPTDYVALKERLAAMQQQGTTGLPMKQATKAFMQNFMRRHAQELFAAPDADLLSLRDEHISLVEAIRDESTAMCAHFVVNGIEPTDTPSQDLVARLGRVGVRNIRAMAHGRDNPVARGRPTEADVRRFAGALRRQGIDNRGISLLIDGGDIAALPEAKQCQLGVALYRALADVPPASSVRLTAVILAQPPAQ